MRKPSLGKTVAAFLVACLLLAIGSSVAVAFLPGEGPGGPVLVVANPADPFSRYYAEILQGEGLNEFDVVDLGSLTPAQLSSHQVIVLAQTTGLTDAQVSTLTSWVQGGGTAVGAQWRALRGNPQADDTGRTARQATTSAPGFPSSPGTKLVSSSVAPSARTSSAICQTTAAP